MSQFNPQQIEILHNRGAIPALYIEGSNPEAGSVAMYHGDGSNPDSQVPLARAIADKTGRNVLIPTYSGQWEGSPIPIEETTAHGQIEEVAVALDWLRNRTHPDGKIAATGISYGGFLATSAAYATGGIDELVLQAPAIVPDNLKTATWTDRQPGGAVYEAIEEYRRDPRQLAQHELWRPRGSVAKRTLVVEHGADECIPPEVPRAYAEHLGGEHVEVPNMTHSIGDSIRNGTVSIPDVQAYNERIADHIAGNDS